jgi:NAD(P)H-hydrate repair Nnr-like enzyme with NAD(P)H-hydrate dehydratase domain
MATAGLTQGWVAKRLPARPPRAHKGTFGRLLIVAGSLEYAGATLLTWLGAIRAGVGLACLATPEAVGLRLLGLVPELTAMLLVEEAPGLTAPAGWRARDRGARARARHRAGLAVSRPFCAGPELIGELRHLRCRC